MRIGRPPVRYATAHLPEIGDGELCDKRDPHKTTEEGGRRCPFVHVCARLGGVTSLEVFLPVIAAALYRVARAAIGEFREVHACNILERVIQLVRESGRVPVTGRAGEKDALAQPRGAETGASHQSTSPSSFASASRTSGASNRPPRSRSAFFTLSATSPASPTRPSTAYGTFAPRLG